MEQLLQIVPNNYYADATGQFFGQGHQPNLLDCPNPR